MFLARRCLFQDKTRLALSMGGVALAVMLVLILKGFVAGMNRQITSYLDNSPSSIVMAEEDVVNLLGATSLIPERTDQEAESVRGVEHVIPILSQSIIMDLHGKKQPAYMVGYETEQGGGPWKISEGHEPDSKWEMVIDQVLAERHGLVIGDQVEVMGRDLTIVGLSRGTISWMTSYFFVREQDAEKILLAPDAISFLLVITTDDADEGYIIGRLSRFSGVSILTKKEMAANDLKLFAKVFSAPLRLMVAISVLIGTMIVGLVIYTVTVERQREYGVIKAIGGRNRFLYRVMLTQAFFASIAGSILGILMANGVAQWIMSIRPQFLIVFDPLEVGQALVTGLILPAIGKIAYSVSRQYALTALMQELYIWTTIMQKETEMFALKKVLSVLVVAGFVLTGCEKSKATEVRITLKEFGIESSMTDFQTGVPYHFVVKNEGAAEHEIMLMPPVTSDSMGLSMNMEKLDDMALAMISASDLPSGATASFDYTFTQPATAGSLELACHTPGHYEMGMKLPIDVK